MFSYAGRTNQGGAKFSSGECAMLTESTGGQANVRRQAKFDWAVTEIPYWDDVPGAPQNAIIGGASLWVMGGKTNNAYKGVAKFFAFLSRPEVQSEWHKDTGYVPITYAAYDMTKKAGFYQQNPGAEVAIKMLTKKPPTPNSKGLRFGNYVQGREVIEEELEAVFSGKKDAKAALDEAAKRGNEILRKFEAANKS
jgi:sn-glycerol 3-phosphate transport system substrate-binding protein